MRRHHAIREPDVPGARAPFWHSAAGNRIDRALPILFAGAFVTAVLSWTSFLDVYEFDSDEGNNLIKALLLDRGHALFAEIWSDQPPLHTYLLVMVFNLVGWEVAYGRVLTLLFAGLLVFAVYHCVKSEFGHVAGCLAGVLLITSREFVRLSVAIMIGLPSLAFAALAAVALLQWRDRHTARWLLLSGCLMGCSLATKFFTVFLPPIFVLYIAINSPKARTLTSWGKPVAAVAVWSVACLVVILACLYPLLPQDATMLYDTHVQSTQAEGRSLSILGGFASADRTLYGSAAVGLILLIVRRNAWSSLGLFALWLVGGVTALSFHNPVWYHHRLLLAVPAAVMAGAGIGMLLRIRQTWIPSHYWTRVGAIGIAIVLTVSLGWINEEDRFQAMREPLTMSVGDRDRVVQRIIDRYRPWTRSMITSRQMYAFRAGISVPPNLAVTSEKRMSVGLLGEDDLLRALDLFKPEQVVLTNKWPETLRSAMRRALREGYVRIYADYANREVEVFVLRTMLDGRR